MNEWIEWSWQCHCVKKVNTTFWITKMHITQKIILSRMKIEWALFRKSLDQTSEKLLVWLQTLCFEAEFPTCRWGAAAALSPIMILSAEWLCVWCRHGAHSQALWVGSCQVVEMSLAQTQWECVPHSNWPISSSRRQAVRCSEPVVGRCSRTGGKNQDGAPNLPQTSGNVAFRFGWLQNHTASCVNWWSEENINENLQMTTLCGPLMFVLE